MASKKRKPSGLNYVGMLVPPEEQLAIKAQAAAERRSVSNLLRKITNEYLQEQREKQDQALSVAV